ncbi:hypothetical protein Sango_2693900 [Sesamum angolense]|uniref:Uncharacterized protein n=1 Tax=Sesamum angolense TaxID=2727404 RepID=A0AAE2BHK0_9LAMI|nr:hypothetical protein Sango_2693900 [Sesamum angolense]
MLHRPEKGQPLSPDLVAAPPEGSCGSSNKRGDGRESRRQPSPNPEVSGRPRNWGATRRRPLCGDRRLINEIHISNPCAIYCFATAPCLNLLLLLHTVLLFLSVRCASVESLGATMGLRRVAVTQANSAARMPGQDAKSPSHAPSPSERAANPKDENSRLTDLVMNLEEKVSSLETEITVLNSELEEYRQVVQEMTNAFGGGGIADMRHEMEQMSIQIGLLQLAVSNVPVIAHDAGARFRIPEPKVYGGARDVKEVENFLFDMEQYFLAANVEDEARKVSTVTMYLTGDVKLWWRTKYAEIQANQV